MAAKRADDAAPALVWLRQDLRLADNSALSAAAATKRPLILFYLRDDETPGRWRSGGAARWWLHHALAALARDIEKRGGRLILRSGPAPIAIPQLVTETGAASLYWNRCYEPHAIARDKALKQTLSAALDIQSFNASLLHEPWEVKSKTNEPYKVFTPYWRAAAQMPTRAPPPIPRALRFHEHPPASEQLAAWKLLPTHPNWARGFDAAWRPGEAGAHAALDDFLGKLPAYPEARDQLAAPATSLLSPHLHWGEISPVQIRAALEAHAAHNSLAGVDKFLSEIGWREFAHHLLFHWPHIPQANWRAQFDAFPWRDDDADFDAWSRGQTGYPVVDAAMRQLWTTGWMHNRARMIAASFLIKHLLIDWRRGADWFWDTLVDADLANNSASWQWVAGSGADAAPYFRIFNPVTQGARYDADGAYVRQWAPELAALPNEFLHSPWEADAATLRKAGVVLGKTYPKPIVDHAAARARALAALAATKPG